ncbi:MAG: hypothetical protein ACOH2R_14125 [Pseudomonas sp.]
MAAVKKAAVQAQHDGAKGDEQCDTSGHGQSLMFSMAMADQHLGPKQRPLLNGYSLNAAQAKTRRLESEIQR